MTDKHKRMLLYGVLVLGLALAAWASRSFPQTTDALPGMAEPLRRRAPIMVSELVSAAPAPDQGGYQLLPRPPGPPGVVNPFGVTSWRAPAPQPTPSAPVSVTPAPAAAPPLPFAYAGKLDVGDGKWLVYLSKGEQSFSVTTGETFDGAYRFDGIDGDTLLIVYLPLGSKQVLPMGGQSK